MPAVAVVVALGLARGAIAATAAQEPRLLAMLFAAPFTPPPIPPVIPFIPPAIPLVIAPPTPPVIPFTPPVIPLVIAPLTPPVMLVRVEADNGSCSRLGTNGRSIVALYASRRVGMLDSPPSDDRGGSGGGVFFDSEADGGKSRGGKGGMGRTPAYCGCGGTSGGDW